jgi:hypothetical protein
MEDIPLRPDGLQLDEDRSFQERFWIVERGAWAAFGLIIACAIAGLTGGGGPLASASRTIGEAEVRYPAITRWTTSYTMKIHLPQGGSDVRLGPQVLDAFEIATIQPQPVAATTTSDGLQLAFRVEGKGAAPVAIRMKALTVGRVDYDVTVEGAGTARLSTLVLP